VNAERADWSPRVAVSNAVGESVGRVVAVDTGVVRVRTRRGTVDASFGATLLAQIVKDADASPRVGDRVRLRTWADGPVTVERVLVRSRTF
jgi:ribosome biogenesis GTPase